MKKQLWALATVLGLGAFATANANVSEGLGARSNVIHWATVVFCEGDDDGQATGDVCVEGHTGFTSLEWVDTTLSAFPGSTATIFLAR